MSIFFNYNDKFYKEGTPVISADNHSLRYGDGLFETIKVNAGIIQLSGYHFERLFAGMALLQFQVPENFTAAYFINRILELCKKNKHNSFTRVRLMIFRGKGGLYDVENNFPNYIIQTFSIKDTTFNTSGFILDIYPDIKKSCNTFSNTKNNNFLPYTMAAKYAQQKKINDCIILNTYNRVCETTLANIFIVKQNIFYTPPLSEGCIAGVMRRFIIEKLSIDINLIEKPIDINDLKTADEIFITNSIMGIKWVKQFQDAHYTNSKIKKLQYSLVKTIE